MMVIAVDTGNRLIKTAHADPFSAGLVRHYEDRPFIATDTLEYDGQFYTFSEMQGYHRQDKTLDDYYFMLTLAAIAREIVMKSALRTASNERDVSFARQLKEASRARRHYTEDIYLSVGLPPSDMRGLAGRFRLYFLRDGSPLHFVYNNITFDITIKDVFVSAQGFAAIYPNDLFSKVIQYPQAYIVDIGGYTTDIALVANKRIDLTFFETIEYGVIHLYNEVASVVRNKHSKDINGVIIEAVLRGEGSNVCSPEIEKTIRDTTEIYAQRLVAALRDRRVDLSFSLPVLVGGGTQLMREPLEAAINRDNLLIIPDIKANAIGYEVFANRILKERQRSGF